MELIVEGEELKQLPNSNKQLPSLLDRDYGINKVYNLTGTNNIDSYTVFYVNEFNDNYYYVPVTKYINNELQLCPTNYKYTLYQLLLITFYNIKLMLLTIFNWRIT